MALATLLFFSVMLVVLAGEAVRVQCRRMLTRPAMSTPAGDAVSRQLGSEVTA